MIDHDVSLGSPYPPHPRGARRRWFAVLAGAAACSPGRFSWPGGTDEIETALVRFVDDGDHHRAELFVSNGRFTCDLPDTEEADVEARRVEALLVAACREGASHVNLTLWREGGGWSGRYTGLSGADAGDLGPGSRRLLSARWMAVDEAYLAGWGDVERTYSVEEISELVDLGDGGFAELDLRGSVLQGTFAFPEGVSGRFRAEVCEDTASLFTVLVPSPQYRCP